MPSKRRGLRSVQPGFDGPREQVVAAPQRAEAIARHRHDVRLLVRRVRQVADAAEQGVIQQARELRDSGLSLAAVAKELDRRGIQARNGKAFAASFVASILGMFCLPLWW